MQHVRDRLALDAAAVERPPSFPASKEDEFTREVRETLERAPGHARMMRQMRDAHAAYTRVTGLRGDETTDMAWLVRAPTQGPDSYVILPEVFPGLHARYVKGWRSEEQLRLEDPQLHAWFRDTLRWRDELEPMLEDGQPLPPMYLHGLGSDRYEIVCCARSALGIADFDKEWTDRGRTLLAIAPDALVQALSAHTARTATMYDDLLTDSRSASTTRAFAYQEIAAAVLQATRELDRSGWTPWDDDVMPWLPAVYLDHKDSPAKIVSLFMAAVRTHVRVPLDEICSVREVLEAGPFHWVFLTTLPPDADLRRDLLDVDRETQLTTMLQNMLWATHALLAPETATGKDASVPHVGGREDDRDHDTPAPSRNQRAIDEWYIEFLTHVAFSNLLPFVGYETDDMSHPALLALRRTLYLQLKRMDYQSIFAEDSGMKHNWREGMVAAADRFADRVKQLQRDAIARFDKVMPTDSQARIKRFESGDRAQFQRRLDEALAGVKEDTNGCPLHRPRTVNTDVAVVMSHILRLLREMPPLADTVAEFAQEQRIIAERMHAEIMRAHRTQRDGFMRVASMYARDRAREPPTNKNRRIPTMSSCLRGALEVAHVLLKVNTGFTGRGIVHVIETLYEQRDAFSVGTAPHIIGQALVEAVAIEAMHFVLADWRAELVSATVNISDDIRGFIQTQKDWWGSFFTPSETTELFQRAVIQSGVTGTSVDAIGGHDQPFFVTVNNATRAQVGWVHAVPSPLDEESKRAWKQLSDDTTDLRQSIQRTVVAGLHGVARAADDRVHDLTGFDMSTRHLVNATLEVVGNRSDGYVVPFAGALAHGRDAVATGIWSVALQSSAMSPTMSGDFGYAMGVLARVNERDALAPTGIPELATSMSDKTTIYAHLKNLVGRVVYNDEPAPGNLFIEPVRVTNTTDMVLQTTAVAFPRRAVKEMYDQNPESFRFQLERLSRKAGAREATTLGALMSDGTWRIGDDAVPELSRVHPTTGTQVDAAPESFHAPPDNRTVVAEVKVRNMNPTDRMAPLSWARAMATGGAGNTGLSTWLDTKFEVKDPVQAGTFDANNQFCGMVVSVGVAISVSRNSGTLRVLTGLPKEIALGTTLLLKQDATGITPEAFVHPGMTEIGARTWSQDMQKRLREIRQTNVYDPRIPVLLDMLQTQEVSAMDYAALKTAAEAANIGQIVDVLDRVHSPWTADRTYYVGKDRHVLNTKTLADALEQHFGLPDGQGGESPLMRQLASSALGAVTGSWVTALIPQPVYDSIRGVASGARRAACLATARMVLANLRYYETHQTLMGSPYYSFQAASAVLTTGVMQAMIRGYITQLSMRGLAWLWNGDDAAWAHASPPTYMPPWQRALATVTRQCTRVFIDGGHLFESASGLVTGSNRDLVGIYAEMLRFGSGSTERIARHSIQRAAKLGLAATSLVALSTLTSFYVAAPVIGAAGFTAWIMHTDVVAHAVAWMQSLQRLAAIASSVVTALATGTLAWGWFVELLVPAVMAGEAAPVGMLASVAAGMSYIPAGVTVVLLFSAAGLLQGAIENTIAHIDTTSNPLYLLRVMRVHAANLRYIHDKGTTLHIRDQCIEPVEWRNVLARLSTAATASGAGLLAGAWFGASAMIAASALVVSGVGIPAVPLLAVAGLVNPTAAATAGVVTAATLASGVQQFVQSVVKNGNAYGNTLSGTVDVFVQLTLRIRQQMLRGRAPREHVPSAGTITNVTKALHGVLDLGAAPESDQTVCAVVREIMVRTLGLLGGTGTLSCHVMYRVERETVTRGMWIVPGAHVNSNTTRVVVHALDRRTEIMLRTADDVRAWVATVAARSNPVTLRFTDPRQMYRSMRDGLKWPLDPNAEASLAQYLGAGDAVLDFMRRVIKEQQTGRSGDTNTPEAEPVDLLDDQQVQAYIDRHQAAPIDVSVIHGGPRDVLLAPWPLLAAAVVYRTATNQPLSHAMTELAWRLNNNQPTDTPGSLRRMYTNMQRHDIAETERPRIGPTAETRRTARPRTDPVVSFDNASLKSMWLIVGAVSPFLAEWLMRAQMPAYSGIVPGRDELVFAGPGGYVVVALPTEWVTSAKLVVPRPLRYTALVPFAAGSSYLDERNPAWNPVARAATAVGAVGGSMLRQVGELAAYALEPAVRRLANLPRPEKRPNARASVM